jgi:hypothetical protein
MLSRTPKTIKKAMTALRNLIAEVTLQIENATADQETALYEQRADLEVQLAALVTELEDSNATSAVDAAASVILATSELATSELAASELAASELAASELAASELAASELAASELAASELAASELAKEETLSLGQLTEDLTVKFKVGDSAEFKVIRGGYTVNPHTKQRFTQDGYIAAVTDKWLLAQLHAGLVVVRDLPQEATAE